MTNEYKLWTTLGCRPHKTAPMAVYTFLLFLIPNTLCFAITSRPSNIVQPNYHEEYKKYIGTKIYKILPKMFKG